MNPLKMHQNDPKMVCSIGTYHNAYEMITPSLQLLCCAKYLFRWTLLKINCKVELHNGHINDAIYNMIESVPPKTIAYRYYDINRVTIVTHCKAYEI